MSLNIFIATSKEIDIPDLNLQAVIREVIDKPVDSIESEDLVNLTELNAHEQGITDITGIEHCLNLQRLDLSINRITDITPLSGLSELQILMLEDNQITDLAPLTELTKLEKLLLNSNLIADISPLSKLINLEQLKLSNNEVVDISPLSYLTHLRLLHLNQNRITDINGLTNLTNLRVLYLDNNDIEDISSLAGLTELGEWEAVWMIHLGLANNRISDINPIFQNPGIGEGDVVDLRDNPLSNPEEIKNTADSKGVTILVTTDSEISLALEGSTFLDDVFTVKINAENFSNLAGFQFNLEFNSDLLEPQEISEGPFLKQGGYTFWLKPKIEQGVIHDISANLLRGGVDGAGELARISFKAIGYGTSIVKLTNIKLTNSEAEPIYISAPESFEVTIPSPYDLNKDGKVNIFDLVLVGNHFGESGPEGDINGDGIVNIFDLVIVGNNF